MNLKANERPVLVGVLSYLPPHHYGTWHRESQSEQLLYTCFELKF